MLRLGRLQSAITACWRMRSHDSFHRGTEDACSVRGETEQAWPHPVHLESNQLIQSTHPSAESEPCARLPVHRYGRSDGVLCFRTEAAISSSSRARRARRDEASTASIEHMPLNVLGAEDAYDWCWGGHDRRQGSIGWQCGVDVVADLKDKDKVCGVCYDACCHVGCPHGTGWDPRPC
jgi:hypothetical protein